MEKQYATTINGQAVRQSDLNLLGETGALADDRVLAELLRMAPFDGTVRKAVLPAAQPYTFADGGVEKSFLVAPDGATGQVRVLAFRAIVGTRVFPTEDALESYRDIRSAIHHGTSTRHTTILLAPNATGMPRWDLVYAKVTLDADGPSFIRKLKDPTGSLVTEVAVREYVQTVVTVGVITGTAAAPPNPPTLTSDSGDDYYIALAYVRVPTGFTGTSTVLATDICQVAEPAGLAPVVGGHRARPGNQHYQVPGGLMSAFVMQTWGTSGDRSRFYMPPSFGGLETIVLAVKALSGTPGVDNVPDGSVLDSGDWRGRICNWKASFIGNLSPSATEFPWDNPFEGATAPQGVTVGATQNCQSGLTQTFATAPANGGRYTVAYVDDSLTAFVAAAQILIYCDSLDGGKLKVKYTGLPNCIAFFWLTFSGPLNV